MGDAADDAMDAELLALDREPAPCGDRRCIVTEPHLRGRACYFGLFENQGHAYRRYEVDLRRVARGH